MLTILVKSDDENTKRQREDWAHRVVGQFKDQLPEHSLLCFFDDQECEVLKKEAGQTNRGFYTPIHLSPELFWQDEFWGAWPSYVKEQIVVDDAVLPYFGKRVFDHLIYLHGSACSSELGLTMTFAHELQHFLQWSFARKLWAKNTLVQNLPRQICEAEGLRIFDVPIEREARIVAKRVAEGFFGVDAVRLFIDGRISETGDANDKANWQFIQSLQSSASFDLQRETRLILQRLERHRESLARMLQLAKDDPDFQGLDLVAP